MIPSTNRIAATFNTETAKKRSEISAYKTRLSTSAQSGSLLV
jgi:hypothetical protein